jgi:hypothetical protein
VELSNQLHGTAIVVRFDQASTRRLAGAIAGVGGLALTIP